MKRFLIIAAIILAVLAVIVTANAVYCTNTLETVNYSVKTEKLNTSLRILLIADQHNKRFGENDSVLLEKITEQKPDIITVCGDMTVSDTADDSVMLNLLKNLSEIAPTYFVYGNHELLLSSQIDFASDIAETGAILLDNLSVIVEKDGEKLLLGGLSDYPYYDTEFPDYDTPERYYWDEIREQSKDIFTVLMHHQPEYISTQAQNSGIDLILCGHTHGGAVRFPFFGSLYAPNQGFFPKYDKGEFDFGDTKMIITSGLGWHGIPRVNNCAEITVIDIN